MKAALRELVGWVDSHYGQGAPASPSVFELAIEPGLLTEAQSAVDQARSSTAPVVVVTDGVAAAAVAANLVWAEAGITPDRVHRGDLSPQEFELLVNTVTALAAAPVRLDDSAAASDDRQ